MTSAKTHHMKVDYNLYEGRRVKGVPTPVMQRERAIVEHYKFLSAPSGGEFLKRQLFTRIWL